MDPERDSIPDAPASVSSNTDSVLRPAMERANSWHKPTQREKAAINDILESFKESLVNGPSKIGSEIILQAANFLGLVVCRVRGFKVNSLGVKVPDTYLFFYSAPGTRNYSGAFMMLRETLRSKVIIISPHDDSDNTRIVTKIAFQESSALAMFSNGHKRNSVKLPTRDSDFCHNSSNNNLATYTIELMCKLFEDHVCLHFHGFVENRKCMVNARHAGLGTSFKNSLVKYSRLNASGGFVALPVSFSIDKIVNTSFYLKTEMPVSIYANNKVILRNVVLDIEKNDWAWIQDSS